MALWEALLAYARWAELGPPGMGAFALEVCLAPAEGADCWLERRGASALVWRIAPGAANWRE